jgi:methionyl-tRNA formyltransferase
MLKQRVLYLGPARPQVLEGITRQGDDVACCEERIDDDDPRLRATEFIVSYGYRHILRPAVVRRFAFRAVNLHIALLPWNRGADPNLWSYLEDTPKGVSIHFIDEGVDTGDLLAQAEVPLGADETLRSSYEKLCAALERLFVQHWPAIRKGELIATPQPPGGTFHRAADRRAYEHLLVEGWDTPVSRVSRMALRAAG